MIASWVIYPLLLAILCLGCGLLVEALIGRRLPGALLLGVGLSAIVIVGEFLTLGGRAAELVTPLAVVLALAGLVLGRRRGLAALDRWAVAAAVAVLCVYAAPIVLSGEPTLAGFIKLDDTATWLAFTDRVMERGLDLGGLAPSTYEATLELNLGEGYPIGAFLPFGIGVELLGRDAAWLIQPYLALLAAILALALWELARPLAGSPRLRAAAAFVGAQPALLFGYYLWGGIKELAAAALLATVGGLIAWLLEAPGERRRVVVTALVAGALLGVLSAGGLIWLAPLLLGAAIPLAGGLGLGRTAARAALFVVALGLCALPLALSGALLPATALPLGDASARGNLLAPLEPAQLAGVWATGDFRLAPDFALATEILIALAVLAAAAAVVACLRGRLLALPIFGAGVLAGAGLLAAVGSPWVEAKAFATASVAIPFAAMFAAGLLASAGRRVAAAGLALAIGGGVVWSNALAYREVDLAPRAQLAELERIGELIAAQGPTLITEYSPYGARHFLREADPESISDLRRRMIPLRDGSEVSKGLAADTDAIAPAALSLYRTLVVRRSPVSSRPPTEYELVWAGESYEVWQRGPGASPALSRIGLGDDADPLATPRCGRVRGLVAGAPAGARLVAADRRGPVLVPLEEAAYPRAWSAGADADAPRPTVPGTLSAEVEVPSAGEYELWLGGSVRPLVGARIDGRAFGEARGELNNAGGYVSFGRGELARGRHLIELEFSAPDLRPGSAGPAKPIGPLALAGADAARSRLVEVDPADARSLCGHSWDWVELRVG